MNKEFKRSVLTLIEDDIAYYRLLSSLNELGIDASSYDSNSCYVVRFLLGRTEVHPDEWCENYFDMIRKGKNLDVTLDRSIIKRLALEILLSLVK